MRIGVARILGVLALSLVVGAAEPVGIDDVIAAARRADIVILGEVHDNPAHHANQVAVVRALQPAALVFEMIPQAAEDEVNTLRDEGAGRDALAQALDWQRTGWPDFAFYAEILEAAPKARVFGAGQPVADVRRAMVEGAAGVFGPDANAYGLDRPLDPADQTTREADLAAAHCGKLPAASLSGMVEAQRFRDAGLADAALWARTMTGDGKVVVIAGSGHADRRRGAPSMLALAAPDVRVFSVGQLEPGDDGDDAFDALLLAPPPARGDPCAGLPAPDSGSE
ncbi:MAG: ChaN family lipoprotein [Amaricoccus sp.]